MKTISATNLRVQLRDLLADLDTGPVMITPTPHRASQSPPWTRKKLWTQHPAGARKKSTTRSTGSMPSLKPTFRARRAWTGLCPSLSPFTSF